MGIEATVDHVGRYKIIGEVGKGAMGVVYKATDPTIGRAVALKTMRVDVHGIESEEMLQRFRNEAKAAGVMKHGNIVTIYDAGEQDGMFYIAMECIEGVTLHRQLADKRVIPVESVIEYSRQVCAGLDYAHSHGVVHRDVKPANIMIEANGALKIMDFGIAKSGSQALTTAGQVLGTPHYMSPEQVKGHPLDGRSDLFSFGVILYEMATGEKPFTGQTVTTIVYKIVHEKVIPPRALNATIHPGLSWIITKALAKSPDERFQTGAELVRALENYKAYAPLGEPARDVTTSVWAPGETGTAAAPASKAARKKGPAGAPAKLPAQLQTALAALARRPMYAFAAFLALGLLVASLGYTYYRHRVAATGEPPAQQQAAAPTQQQTISPPAGGPQATGSQPASGGTASQLSGTTSTATEPAGKPPEEKPVNPPKRFSPAVRVTSAPIADGRRVAPGSGELRLTSYPSGSQVQIDGWTEPTWITPFSSPSMSAGKHAVAFSKAGYITQTRTVEVAAGQALTLHATLPMSVSTLSVSSDPAGAAILVDGKETGKVTPAKLSVEKGGHKIVVRKAGFADSSVSTDIAEGETFEFAPKLQPGSSQGAIGKLKSFFGGIPAGKGEVDIRSNPKGAEIAVNGHPFEKKAPAKIILDPGIYSIALKLEGYKPAQRTVIIEAGKKVPLDHTLEKQ